LALAWRLFGKKFLFDHHDLSPEMYEAKYKRQGGLLYRALLWLESGSAVPMLMTPDEFGAHARSEIEKWAKIIKANAITAE
jgi:hypothetical protein